MEAFLDGDARAFEQLFRQISPRVLAALAHMSGDPGLAEDLTQIAFLKMYRARTAYQRGMQVLPWVLAIARNTFLDHRRHAVRQRETLSLSGTLPEPTTDRTPEPAHAAEQTLTRLLAKLPDTQREALVLLKVVGLTPTEAAALCGTSASSMKMRLSRAYRHLHAIFEKGGLS